MTKSALRPRKAACLSDSLQRSLSMYAVAAGAAGVQLLALAPASEAEVVYTPAHVAIGKNQTFSFDLNHDGTNDFTISNLYRQNSTYSECRLSIVRDSQGRIAYNKKGGSSSYLAADFRKGATIGRHERFTSDDAVMEFRFILYKRLHLTYGHWLNVKDGYLGLAFKFDGAVHYGWARVSVRLNGLRMSAFLTGYAYETQPDTPIIAGDTGGVEDDAANDETPPQLVPASGISKDDPMPPTRSLGALSLGALGLSRWRQ